MPDSRRVISRLFVAGQEDFGATQSRATQVLERVLALSDDEVNASLDDVYNRFVDRHEDLTKEFETHAHRMANRVQPGLVLSDERWRLIGAVFTHEFSVESSALTNPSMVAHPDQTDVDAGSLRFVMSVRGIGEGHRSSIGFRSGIVNGIPSSVPIGSRCFNKVTFGVFWKRWTTWGKTPASSFDNSATRLP
jgi:hypothetical protein